MDSNFLGLGLFSNNRRKKLEDKLSDNLEKNPSTPAPNPKVEIKWNSASDELDSIYKTASSKLDLIDEAFKDNKIAREVAYMIATSHEYKVPNQKAAITLVNNYSWTEKVMKITELQGIDKPIIKSKVLDIAIAIKGKKVKPLMVVDKFQGITPQSSGKKILLDGHHRKEALEFLGIKEIPVYVGKYNGKSEKKINEIIKGR